MAQINLSVDDRRNLAKWMDFRNIKLSLIYSTAQEGWTGEAFHEHCDNHCPLLVVAATPSGYVFGGYATMPWVREHNTHLPAPGSFLFRLKKDDRADYMKFAGTDEATVKSCNKWGPRFSDKSGNGALCFFATDFVTIHPTQKFVTSDFLVSNISRGFLNNGEDNKKALTGGDMRLLNVEVYTVEGDVLYEEEDGYGCHGPTATELLRLDYEDYFCLQRLHGLGGRVDYNY